MAEEQVIARAGTGDFTTIKVLQHIPAEQQLRLVFKDISCYAVLPPSEDGSLLAKVGLGSLKEQSIQSTFGQQTREKQVLFDVSGEVLPGEVLALMGPSGCGKTTLLSVLAGRAPRQLRVTGSISSNGARITKAVRRRIGYVLQDDLLHANLTVYETLFYTARLRLPKEATLAEKMDRTNAVIAELGLDKCRSTIIGGHFAKGISGGERKRVSIGQELLLNPAVLFLDEPTSGLDSTTAMYLITTLNSVAQAGRGVMTTIHQPSSRLYQGLQKLMLLAGGHTMYYGKAHEVVEHFDRVGLVLPLGVSTPEFILDVAMGDTLLPGMSKDDSIDALCKTYEKGKLSLSSSLRAESKDDSTKVMHVSVNMADTESGLDGLGAEETSASSAAELPSGDGPIVEHTGAGYAEQLYVLTKRDLSNRKGNSWAWQNLWQFGAIGVLTGIFWWQRGRGHNSKDAESTAALLYLELMIVTWSTLFGALFTFPTEFQLLLKERASGLYQLSAYYWAHSASDVPMDCLYPSAYVVIVYFLGGLRLSAWAFFANWASLMLMVLTGQSIGLFLGASINNPRTLMSTAIILVGCLMIVGGFFVRNMPVWIDWVKYLSLFYYGYNLLLKINFSGVKYEDCKNGVCTAFDVTTGLNLPANVNDSAGMDIGLLLAIFAAFRLATFLMLKHRTGGL